MTCIQLILFSLFYIIHALVLVSEAAPWKLDVNNMKIKKHHTRFCIYIRDNEPQCVDTDTDAEGMTDEKKKEFLQSIFHLEHKKVGPASAKADGENQRDPERDSAEDVPDTNPPQKSIEGENTGGHPLATVTQGEFNPVSLSKEEISSYEVVEAERDFYKSLYATLLETVQKFEKRGKSKKRARR